MITLTLQKDCFWSIKGLDRPDWWIIGERSWMFLTQMWHNWKTKSNLIQFCPSVSLRGALVYTLGCTYCLHASVAVGDVHVVAVRKEAGGFPPPFLFIFLPCNVWRWDPASHIVFLYVEYNCIKYFIVYIRFHVSPDKISDERASRNHESPSVFICKAYCGCYNSNNNKSVIPVKCALPLIINTRYWVISQPENNNEFNILFCIREVCSIKLEAEGFHVLVLSPHALCNPHLSILSCKCAALRPGREASLTSWLCRKRSRWAVPWMRR